MELALSTARRQGALARLVLLWVTCSMVGCDASPQRKERERIVDPQALLTPERSAELAHQLALLEREAGVDGRVWIGGPEPDALLFESLEVGRQSPEGRGILFVYDVGARRLRVEVSHALEPLFPDAMLGDLLYRHARHLFERGDPGGALRLGLRVLNHRLRLASLEGDLLARAPLLDPAAPWASGAGAGESMEGAAPPGSDEASAEPPAPTASVREVYAHYLEWLAAPRFDRAPGFVTPESRGLLADFPMTPGYREFVLLKEIDEDFSVAEVGDRAILFHTTSPFVAPHFFARSEAGWRMDLVAETREVANLGGGPHTWTFVDGPYTRALASHLEGVGGIVRVRGGDNRALPSTEPRGVSEARR